MLAKRNIQIKTRMFVEYTMEIHALRISSTEMDEENILTNKHANTNFTHNTTTHHTISKKNKPQNNKQHNTAPNYRNTKIVNNHAVMLTKDSYNQHSSYVESKNEAAYKVSAAPMKMIKNSTRTL